MAETRLPPSPLGPSAPLVPPLYQSSVYTLPDLDALDQILDAREPGFIYARDAHPNAHRLAAQLAAWEGAQWACITSSGMAAISAIVLATVQQGQRVVTSHRLYGRTTQLFQQELPRFGAQTTFVDTSDLEQVRSALETPARLLFVETLSNPLLRASDVAALARLAHDAGCLLVVDNTFATPVLVRPLELGADLVMESLTKMIGGHSDVTLGLVCGNNDMLPEVSQVSSIWGLASNPFDCWLAERGLTTLAVRMKTASANAAALADWLAQQSRRGARGLSRTCGSPRSRVGRTIVAERFRQYALFRSGRGTRRGQSFYAPVAWHSIQPLARPYHDNVQSSGDHLTPLRQSRRETATRDHGWTRALVGRLRGTGYHPAQMSKGLN